MHDISKNERVSFMKRLIIAGAGGLGKEVAWEVAEQKEFQKEYQLIGFVDDREELQQKEVNGLPVLGTLDWLVEQKEPAAVLIAIGSAAARKAVAKRCKENKKLSFPSFVASHVVMSDRVSLGEGCIICPGAVITVDTTIGDFALVNYSCTVGHDVVIKDYVTLYPGAHISGNVTIHEVTEIGVGASIIQGKTIGDHVILGAGAVVIRDIESCCTAVGVPAQKIK